jgi:hypothetical protein
MFFGAIMVIAFFLKTIHQQPPINMQTGLRDHDDMKRRLEELELADYLNLLLLQRAGEAMDGIGIVDLLRGAFAEYIVETELPQSKMAELNAKMTSYVDAVMEDLDLADSACLYWIELNRSTGFGQIPEDIRPF